jgi:hypothetical protein
MRTTSFPFILMALLLPLLSMASCESTDVSPDTQAADGDATSVGCFNDSDCESGFSCQNGACESDNMTLTNDVNEGSNPTTDATAAMDESSPTNDTAEGGSDSSVNDDDATDASNGSGMTDTFEEDNDAENGNVVEGDLKSCKDNCIVEDLKCTGVCNGSPLCLAQCAAANTDCKDACDAAFGG